MTHPGNAAPWSPPQDPNTANLQFNPPPGWPIPPPDFQPPPGWAPDASWPPAPPGWRFWTLQRSAAQDVSPPPGLPPAAQGYSSPPPTWTHQSAAPGWTHAPVAAAKRQIPKWAKVAIFFAVVLILILARFVVYQILNGNVFLLVVVLAALATGAFVIWRRNNG